MVEKCPVQDSQNLKVGLYKCPTCGTEVEIFSDETRITCINCGTYVYRKKTPACIEWCAKARECLGEERWNRPNKKSRGEEGYDNKIFKKDNPDK